MKILLSINLSVRILIVFDHCLLQDNGGMFKQWIKNWWNDSYVTSQNYNNK